MGFLPANNPRGYHNELSSKMIKGLIAFAIIVILIAGLLFLFLSSSHSSLAFAAPKAIGAATPITVHITNPHGLRRISARIEQNGTSKTLAESNQPANRVTFWRVDRPPQDFHFTAGS